jgi:hypothetical protein
MQVTIAPIHGAVLRIKGVREMKDIDQDGAHGTHCVLARKIVTLL